jgi:hypothetical protein
MKKLLYIQDGNDEHIQAIRDLIPEPTHFRQPSVVITVHGIKFQKVRAFCSGLTFDCWIEKKTKRIYF